MSADLSKVRFDPLRDHSGIGIQQGRVWLDSDINEQIAITDRRLRAQVVDLQPTRVVVSRLTPDAFKISVAGGVLSIGAGRMYVDGLLAENHGETTGFEPILAEVNGSGDTDYQSQSAGYWPRPAVLPEAGSYLVYLDVWERELTHLNAPDLVESAIGVDTATRTQIVWQVRALALEGNVVGCDAELPAWDALTAPSSARLSTGTVATDPVDDPCEIPPGTGYRGPGNQLYRVEAHSDTHIKWSRDNASVGSVVTEVISGTTLRLQSLGRDEVLGIANNDWVEITDDARELAHQAGEMRQVTVDVAASTITFSTGLPADLTALTHHLRVRKWDSGLIPIPAAGASIPIEFGITATITGTPRPTDYWVFAARATAPSPDASWEKLVDAPPRGTHHHCARLAMVRTPATVTDCRPTPEDVTVGDDCACEICVSPEEHDQDGTAIHDAIERLKRIGGGTVRLCPGVYDLERPVELAGARSIRIRGCGAGTELVARNAGILITECQDVVLDDFAVRAAGEGPCIALGDRNEGCRLENLELENDRYIAVGMAGIQQFVTITGCRIKAKDGIAALPTSAEGLAAAAAVIVRRGNLLTANLTIENNFLECDDRGIDFDIRRGGVIVHGARTSIAANTILGCFAGGIVVTGLVYQDIGDVDGALSIRDNTIEVTGTGIMTGGRVRISENSITAADPAHRWNGIAIQATPPGTPNGVAHVLANKISGVGQWGISVDAPMRNLIVADNVIRRSNSGIRVLTDKSGMTAHVENNQMIDLQPPDVEGAAGGLATGPAMGILVTGADFAAVRGNTVDTVATREGRGTCGIGLLSCGEAQVVNNSLSGLGLREDSGLSTGIAAGAWRNAITIANNSVVNMLGAGPSPFRPAWQAVRLVDAADGQLTSSAAKVAGTTWSIWRVLAALRKEVRTNVEMHGNVLQGGGELPAVEVRSGGGVIANGNHCAQPPDNGQPAIRLRAEVAVVQGNRLFGGRPSMSINADVDKISVMGNIATSDILILGTPVENTGKPWSHLNTKA